MKGLGYLFFTTIKNYFKDMKNHPSKLILNLIFVALLVLVIFSRQMGHEVNQFRDISEFYAMVFILYGTTFLLSCLKGFSSGASFYSMADVNLLFSLPISSKKILFYGLIKQMGTSLLVGLFLLFQYAWLNMTYGVSFLNIIIILIGYCIVLFSAQVTSMAIYSFTSGDETKKKILKKAVILLCIIVIGYALEPMIKLREINISALVEGFNLHLLDYVPVVGWTKAFIIGILTSNILAIVSSLLANIVYVGLIIFFIIKSKGDYYEDVLKATEVSFSAITAKKEGKAPDTTPVNVKVGKTGIGRGKGATVFFYKHLLESRRGKLFILDKSSLIIIAICIAYSVIIGDTSIISIFMFATYMQLISIMSSGRWVKELILPYVYMIPVSPFKKLVMLVGESIYKSFIEAIVLFVPIGIIISSSPFEVIACIIARVGFGILFISVNFLVDRIMGSLSNKIIILFLYFIIIVILTIPGVLLGILLSSVFIQSTGVVLLGTFISNIIIAGIITFICKDILSYPELNNR